MPDILSKLLEIDARDQKFLNSSDRDTFYKDMVSRCRFESEGFALKSFVGQLNALEENDIPKKFRDKNSALSLLGRCVVLIAFASDYWTEEEKATTKKVVATFLTLNLGEIPPGETDIYTACRDLARELYGENRQIMLNSNEYLTLKGMQKISKGPSPEYILKKPRLPDGNILHPKF